MQKSGFIALMMAAAVTAVPLAQRAPAPAKLDALKQEAVADVESRARFSQQMVDQIQPGINYPTVRKPS